jgi:anti-sigma B factor antagonist
MKPSFDIDIVERDDDVILILDGEIDLATASLLEEQLVAVEAQHAASVIVDLDRVSFMDSTGLQVLIAHTLSNRNGHQVRLTKGSPQVQRLFEVSGLRDHLPFVTSN